jgi:hypothetical protein
MEASLNQDIAAQTNVFQQAMMQDLNQSAARASECYNFDFLQGAPRNHSEVPAYNWEHSS